MRKRVTVKTAWIVAITAFTVTLAIGPITQTFLLPNQAEPIHYFATYGMLASVILLMIALLHDRKTNKPRAEIKVGENSLTITPCDSTEMLRLDQESLEDYLRTGFLPDETQSLGHYRVVCLEELRIPPSASILLSKLTSMQVLDVTRSTLPPNFWTILEGCSELEHVLAWEATDSSLPKEIFMSVPEIRVHSQRMSLISQT